VSLQGASYVSTTHSLCKEHHSIVHSMYRLLSLGAPHEANSNHPLVNSLALMNSSPPSSRFDHTRIRNESLQRSVNIGFTGAYVHKHRSSLLCFALIIFFIRGSPILSSWGGPALTSPTLAPDSSQLAAPPTRHLRPIPAFLSLTSNKAIKPDEKWLSPTL